MLAATPRTDLEKAQWLLHQADANDGLAPVDLERFWHDQDLAARDPFSPTIPQLPLNVFHSSEPVFDELGIPEDFWRLNNDPAWRVELHKAYNDRAEKIIGRRVLSEKPPPPAEHRYPKAKELHDIFEGVNEWHGWSWWLRQAADDESQLAALLDRVERRLEKLREFLLPPEWANERDRLMKLGIKPPLYRAQRGPCTFACSIFGPENMLLLVMDNPQLAGRFCDLILRAMLERARILDEQAGYNPPTAAADPAPRGFVFLDDNSCLFNPEMYEFFGFPILQQIFATYSPDRTDRRYQHSDSAMGHLLPILSRLNLTGVNFGPTLTVREIREHCPNAVIEGQLAPFTFSRNESLNLVLELLRDFEQAKEKRGLLFSTAGSINNGSSLKSMRLLMSAAQHFCRYDEA
jgi:uroporphyrinogen decarboxylase